MKGLTHFISGVAMASFIPAATKLANSNVASSYILVLGGLFGILPDTLDFKFGQFMSRVDYDVDADSNNPDPQKMAEQIGRAIDECYTTGRYVKAQLYPMRMGADLWRQYVIKFDGEKNEIVVVINEIVTTSQIPYLGSAPKQNRVGRYKLKGRVFDPHGRPSVVDIMSGPQYGFKKVGDVVEVEFLPWHRTWSHSFVLGFFLSIGVWLLASLVTGWGMGWLYGLVAFLGYAIHITEDLTGHMGGSLLWPFRKDRTNGLCLFTASSPHANFAVNYVAVALLIYNLSRFSPQPPIKLGTIQYLLYAMAIPLAVYGVITKLFGEKGGKKKGGLVSAEKALAEEERMKMEELEYDATDTTTGDAAQ
jgi:membrane-bound metal-dependent hydrolase YbcI (DUF457 family)